MSETIDNHRRRVFEYMARLSQEVMRRGNEHDQSKYSDEEYPIYVESTAEFSKYPFGSEGYYRTKEKMKSAIDHHYKHNRHHPEHHPNGIDDMNLVDIMELLMDWKSATLNHPEMLGDILKSVEMGAEKYNIPPTLKKIMLNTLRDFDLLDNRIK